MNPSVPVNYKLTSLALNPAIDLTYQIDNLLDDHKSRSHSTRFDPGGTGMNVGRALEALTSDSITCCLIAGCMGEFFRNMADQKLERVHYHVLDGETRINTTVIQDQPSAQYEINAAGPAFSDFEIEPLVSTFIEYSRHGTAILTGSLPPGVSTLFYKDLCEALHEQGGCCVVDLPVNLLNTVLETRPFLIKPNLYEFQKLVKQPMTQIDAIARHARILQKTGIEYVCVSLGEKGAVLVAEENSYFCPAPEIQLKSSVGAGDALLAGLAFALSEMMLPEEALKLAVSCGAATASLPGTEIFKKNLLDSLMQQTKVQKLDI